MDRPRILPSLLVAASIATALVQSEAQTVREVTSSQPSVKEKHPIERPVPFSLAADNGTYAIEFRTADQMTRNDRDLEADAELSISEHARFAGLEFGQGNWSYEQVVCPALPNHLFLRFTRNNGKGDVSIFSASIPRNGEGRVRIIPILKRSYSLWSPAPINAITIAAFNRIRTEEHPDSAPGWLGIGMCYAALAGGSPQAALSESDTRKSASTVAMPAKLEIPERGNVALSFADVAAAPRPMDWTMIFNRKGKLLKASHKPAELIPAKVIHPAPVVLNGYVAVSALQTPQPAPTN